MAAGLFKKARDRQRRRRRAIGGVLLMFGIAALVVVLGLRGAEPSNHTAGGAPSSVDWGVESISARAFAKYRLSCWSLRQASIPVGPESSRWCKPDSVESVVFLRLGELPRVTCKVLSGVGIQVGPTTSRGCMFHFVPPVRRV